MPRTAKGHKFKKIRLHKAAKELNLTIDTIVEYLAERGHKDALKGNGVNAAITDEDAYLDLLENFSEDREMRARVQELRALRESELTDSSGDSAPVNVSDVVQEVVEPTVNPDPASESDPEAVSEPEAEPVSDSVSDPVEDQGPVTELEDAEEVPSQEIEADPEAGIPAESEPVPEAAATAEAVAPEAAEADPVAEAGKPSEAPTEVEPVEEAAAISEDSEAVTEQEVEGPEAQTDEPDPAEDTELPLDEAETDDDEVEVESGQESDQDDVISADRYKLQGTKILGKIDLKTVEGEGVPGPKRKGKRKRKKVAKTAGQPVTEVDEKPAEKAPSTKRKRKRKAKVDTEAVGQSVQETLRSLDQTSVRVRQRRRRARRQQRAEERQNIQNEQKERDHEIRVTEFISTGELADLMGIPVTDIISMLLSSGMMVSINQRLDADTIAYVADEFDFKVEFITEFGSDDIEILEDDPEDLISRAPVVTVMGHVDHGKTSLLDYVRNASVAEGESGGITQHIGAYKVALEDHRVVTFLDTPGHEAFTAMRARGAKVTDVVILVVAANDSVMPQTIEAINHAKAAGVSLIIAINKIDLEQADVQRVMKELSDHGVLVEQYGGKVQCAFVSAKTGEGIDDLLEKVLLEADLMELQGNPKRHAQGIVIESRLDRGRGNIATVLVQNGTLKVGDPFIAGIYGGRVRAMFDERDNRIETAGPSEPALVLGLPGQPMVGDQLAGTEDESEAREIAQRRQQIWREQKMRQYKHVRLEDIGRRMALGDFNELNLIIKADVGGSVEAISDSLHKISTSEVAVNIIHSGVGAITESDVMLASASDAVIIGFQVRPTAGARSAAEREEIDIRTYSIIYDAIEDVRDALEGLLTPEETEKITGVAEVREVFKVPKIGSVAGCHVSEGRIRRNDTVHVLRESIVIYKGRLASLRRFKDDVREVVSGYECGIGVENYNDIKVGDQIEAFEMIQTKRTLEAS